MTIPLVSSAGTNQVWILRTNQAIGVVNALTDGALTLNGSVTFSNATFSLILPSLNVANTIVVTSTSGNSFFLTSSNSVTNGTAFITGAGNGLYVANNAIIGGNLTVNTAGSFNGTLSSNNEIIGNANVQISGVDGQFRAVQGNFGVLLKNDGTSFSLLTTGSVANATTAPANSLRPFTWNQSTGAITIDGTQNGTTFGGVVAVNGTGNALTVANNTVLQGNLNINGAGVGLVVKNAANLQGQVTFGGLLYANSGMQMSNTAITFDKNGTTFAQYNPLDFAGDGGLQLVGNLQVNGQMVVSGTATFTNTVTFQTATDQSLTVVNRATIGNNLVVTNKVTAGNGVFSDLHSTGRILSDGGEVVAKLGTSGQFRAITSTNGLIIRNDGANSFLLTTGTTATPDTTSWTAARPLAINMTTGAITLDGSANGTTFGGAVSIGTQSISTGVTIGPTQLILPNNGFLSGKDTSGIARGMITCDTANFVDVFAGAAGFRVLNITGSTTLASFGTTGAFTAIGTITAGGAIVSGSDVTIPNGHYYYGHDTGNVARPLIGFDTLNIATLWAGTNYWRVINSAGSAELLTIQNNGNTNSLAPFFQISGQISIGGGAPIAASGVVSAYGGYSCKVGTAGGFRANVYNIDWDGAAAYIDIDNNINIARFPAGTGFSDRRLKQDIEDAPTDALTRIRALREVTYRLKNNELIKNLSEIAQLGYIADELEKIIPESVFGEKDAVNEDGTIKPQGLNTLPIITTATQAISELADKYDDLEKRISILENSLAKY